MKIKKLLISLFIFIFCLCSCGVLVRAASNSRIVFTNGKPETAVMVVTKQVVSTAEGYEIPDADFAFTLKLNGSLVKEREYRLFSADGSELGVNKTSLYGDFTLKAGQTARFENLSAGMSYEVTESETEDFELISPAGPAVGTLADDGAAVTFTNMYTPNDPKAETAVLRIQKNISFPENYELWENPQFSFTLKLGGNLSAGTAYHVYDTRTGEIVNSGKTNANGVYTLSGGQTAEFPEIPTGYDYEITEESLEGWRVIGSAKKDGAVIAPATNVTYTNVSASFAVTKQLSDYTTPEDVLFTFRLTKKDQSVWPDAGYYLYSIDGELLDKDPHQTTSEGLFTLAPGQTAVFYGIPAGETYSVQEISNPQYTQTIPTAGEGYQNKTVLNSVEVLPFVNRAESIKALTVTKHVENYGPAMPETAADFTFLLEQYNDAAGVYEPAANAVYSIKSGSSSKTYKTAADGTFTLKDNETARFEYLLEDAAYRVTEIETNVDYDLIITKGEPNPREGVFSDSLDFVFTNVYRKKQLDVIIFKRDAESKKEIEGVEFDLYRTADQSDMPIHYITDKDGYIRLYDLEPGTYYLVETKTLPGYKILAQPVKLEFGWERDADTNEGTPVVQVDGEDIPAAESGDRYLVEPADRENDYILNMAIDNERGYELPETGGAGSYPYILCGMILMAGVMILRRRQV